MTVALRALAGASLLGAASLPAGATLPSRPVGVEVMDCYSSMPDVDVRIDDRHLALRPPGARDDSIGLCFSGTVSLAEHVRVDIKAQGRTRHVALRLGDRSKWVVISAAALTAKAATGPVWLD